jgi:hypothetical protein
MASLEEEKTQIPFTGSRQIEHCGSLDRLAQVEHKLSFGEKTLPHLSQVIITPVKVQS